MERTTRKKASDEALLNALSILTKEEVDALNANVSYFTPSSGSKLAYREIGDPNGHPFIFFHGTGAHIHPMMLHKPGQHFGFRFIVPTRPGIADSEFRPWTPLDFARDMKELAEHLKLDKFGIMGISGGGPTLMATALTIPEKLVCVINLACAAPLYGDPVWQKQMGFTDRIYAKLAKKAPLWLMRFTYSFVYKSVKKGKKDPGKFVKMFHSSLCEADQKLFEIPQFQYMFMRDFQESFKSGTKGPSYDAQRIVRDWGFRVSDINTHVDLFQGEDDLFVPLKFAKYYTETLKDYAFHLSPHEGHFDPIAYGYRTLKKIKTLYYDN